MNHLPAEALHAQALSAELRPFTDDPPPFLCAIELPQNPLG